jgi:hypothetical protein
MAKFAETTDVPVERSQAEIQRTIQRYGASSFMTGYQGRRAIVAFESHGKRVRFDLQLPDPKDEEFTKGRINQHSSTLTDRPPEKAAALWEQACRQRWRALLLLIKAKLEAVEAGITTFEEEMLSHIVMPDGRTVSETIVPGLEKAITEGGKLPPLLGSGKGTAR